MTHRAKIVFLVLGLAVFTYLVLDFGIDNILLNLRRTGWWFLPVVAVWGVVYCLNAGAWYVILRDEQRSPGYGTLLQLTVSGFALNYVTPFLNLGGEPYRVLALREAVGVSRAVSSVILFYMVRILSHCLFWLGSIVLIICTIPVSGSVMLSLGVAFVVVAGIIVFFFMRHRNGIFTALLDWLPRVRLLRFAARAMEKRRETLLNIDDQIRHLYVVRRGAFFASLAFEFASRLAASLEFWFILRALGHPATVADAFVINAVSSLILNILFFIPFELGAREGGLYLIMEAIGFSAGLGIFMGLVNRLRELVWIGIGFLLMWLTGRTPRNGMEVDVMGAQGRT